MSSFVFYLSATVLFAQSTVAFNCSKPPIYVDIHKRAVHESSVFQYGSFIGVGSPAQNHSLWPSLSQNHTSFGAKGYCGNSTLGKCLESTGGFFVQDDSSSFKQEDIKSLDSQRNGTFKGFLAKDTLHLYTHYFETDGASQTLLEDSIIEVATEGSITPGIVGIGQSSTVMGSLYSKDLIAGKTYSLYIGQGFDRAGGAVNGSNTFGGYDAGRFKGKVHQYTMNQVNMNPMTVRVKDIVITENPNDPNTNTSLFGDSKEPFEAQITTDQYPLSLPYDITQNFISKLGAKQDNYWGDNSLKLENPFNGTLSIVLEDGFTVTIPSEVLSNKSGITPIQDRAKDSTAPFYLSTAFLTQVYLMADFETYQFYLAEAVQKNNAVMPQTFCPKTIPAPYVKPKQNAWVQQGLIGAVIGGVLGGMGIGICAYCFVLGCRRRRAEKMVERELERGRKEAKMAQFHVEEAPEFDGPPKTPKTSTPFFFKKPW